MKRIDSNTDIPSSETIFIIVIDGDIAEIAFEKINNPQVNPTVTSFRWKIQREEKESFRLEDLAQFIEKTIQEYLLVKAIDFFQLDVCEEPIYFRMIIERMIEEDIEKKNKIIHVYNNYFKVIGPD